MKEYYTIEVVKHTILDEKKQYGNNQTETEYLYKQQVNKVNISTLAELINRVNDNK